VSAVLRTPVLAAMHRELTAQRRDRRLVRIAAALLVVGIGLNWTVDLHDGTRSPRQLAISSNPAEIVEVAVAVAEATDAQTASHIAQQLAGVSALSVEETAALEQEIQRRVKNGAIRRKEG